MKEPGLLPEASYAVVFREAGGPSIAGALVIAEVGSGLAVERAITASR